MISLFSVVLGVRNTELVACRKNKTAMRRGRIEAARTSVCALAGPNRNTTCVHREAIG